MPATSPFAVIAKDLGNGNEILIVDIEDISVELKDLIDTKFVKICEGNSGTDLAIVKKRLIDFLTPKKGSTHEIGTISEFFLHLFLNHSGFSPQFLYRNLEEGAPKKGFDGYYLANGLEWIVESKSGSASTVGVSHKSKVKEAYTDLESKFGGKVPNNPWQNAYNHASHIDVNADSNTRANIKKFSDLYSTGTFHSTKQFNIIPSSTLVLDGTWVAPDYNQVETEINELINDLQFNKIKVLCITKRTLQLFWDYLNL